MGVTLAGRPLTLAQRTHSPLDRRWSDSLEPHERPEGTDHTDWALLPLRDQGKEGSCSAQSGCYAKESLERTGTRLSAAFLYESERLLHGAASQDSGAQLRDTEQVLLTTGVCPEADDPYTLPNFDALLTPRMLNDARDHRIIQGYWCPTLGEIRSALAAGLAVQIGVVVYSNFEDAPINGEIRGYPLHIVPMPDFTESPLGGHALWVAKDDRHLGGLVFANSWGDWGWGFLPDSFIEDPNLLMDARAYL